MRWIRKILRKWVDARGPRLRIAVAQLLTLTGLDHHGIRRVASQLQDEGQWSLSLTCWINELQHFPADESALTNAWKCALTLRDPDVAWRLLLEAQGAACIPPARLVWLAGACAATGHWVYAGRVLEKAGAETLSTSMLLPSLVSGERGGEGAFEPAVLVEECVGGGSASARHDLARLCFALGNLDVAGRLYAGLDKGILADRECAAALYAMTFDEAGAKNLQEVRDRLACSMMGDGDALLALTYVALIAEEAEKARQLLNQALTVTFGERSDLDLILADAETMLDQLLLLRSGAFAFHAGACSPVDRPESMVAKRFICGFGWTGSGAVYDAVRSCTGFREFEGAGASAHLNMDSDTEATFIQSKGGLGWLWKRLQGDPRVDWHSLWDLFRCHVIGLCPTGYSEFKACSAAKNHVLKYGHLYTSVFARFFSGFVDGLANSSQGNLHKLFVDATEALCEVAVHVRDGRAVLFNNAIFARNLSMLEIFEGGRAIVVYRDPRDVFVDRMRCDRNHWRSPAQMAQFYVDGIRSYMKYKVSLRKESSNELREVSFERFVNDVEFREAVCNWVCEDVGNNVIGRWFDPEYSRCNIGIFRGALPEESQGQLLEAVKAYREMDRLSALAWGKVVGQ